jgi:hypothetical protein
MVQAALTSRHHPKFLDMHAIAALASFPITQRLIK